MITRFTYIMLSSSYTLLLFLVILLFSGSYGGDFHTIAGFVFVSEFLYFMLIIDGIKSFTEISISQEFNVDICYDFRYITLILFGIYCYRCILDDSSELFILSSRKHSKGVVKLDLSKLDKNLYFEL